MAKTQKSELMKLDPNKVVELDQWKIKLEQLVKDNPFIEVVDAKSYDEAKRRRTALKSGRTEVQKQDGLLATFLSNFRKSTKKSSETLIEIVEPHEKKQQSSIDVWESEIERKKQAAAAAEQLRVQTIKDKLIEIEQSVNNSISNLTFETKDSIDVFESLNTEFSFDEFDFLFNEIRDKMEPVLKEKINQLIESENKRLEDLKVFAENKMIKMCMDAQNEIDAYNEHNEDENLIEKIDSIFDPLCFDFGDLTVLHNENKNAFIQKALDKVEFINEKTINDQRQRIFDVREGLLDVVFQMTIDDYEEKTEYIQKALEQSHVPEVKEDFEKMKSIVEKSLKQKLEIIADEVKKKNEALEKMEMERAELLNKRIEHLQKIGMEIDNDKNATGFGLQIDPQTLMTLNDEEFNDSIVYIEKAKSEFGKVTEPTDEIVSDDKNDLEVMKLEGDKKMFIRQLEFIENTFDEVKPFFLGDKCVKIHGEMKVRLLEFINKEKETINNLTVE